jgi:hypothetical protein
MGYERTVLKAATGAVAVGALVAALVSDGLPRAREVAAAWMTPPYLYLVINSIIISIAASSRFQPSSSDSPSASAELEPEQQVVDVAPLHVPTPVPVVPVQASELVAVEESVVKKKEKEDYEFSISRSSWTPRRRVAEPVVVVDKDVEDSREKQKPLVSTRFSRKASKPSPEGNTKLEFLLVVNKKQQSPNLPECSCSESISIIEKQIGFYADGGLGAGSKALRVARPRKEETLEGTWKAITEGRAPPLARHLKKSDTGPGRRPSGGSGDLDPAALAGAMRKAEMFNDGRSGKAPVVRCEPSLGQDDLNRRVEAFIHKFNMEMRLQRQESLNHYNEMLRLGGGGTHYY